ncbi:MAG TPA: hypothetical protein VLM86_00090 [Candidatus Bathyarchaeia archaeon]|nr:hypothetical protein [Candidatus Bathyarchaeia archaeon]
METVILSFPLSLADGLASASRRVTNPSPINCWIRDRDREGRAPAR